MPGDRMFASLPAVFRLRDQTGDLGRLLHVLEVYLFGRRAEHDGSVALGLEQYLDIIPALFSPMHTPDRFVHWLAAWLSFTPHELFGIRDLRRILAEIVPLYGYRGTRNYLERLITLCFADTVATVDIDDRPGAGFRVGASRVGIETRLTISRPFFFNIVVGLHENRPPGSSGDDFESLQRRLRAIIDFAKPAFTAYDLEIHRGNRQASLSHRRNG
jgi:phage tail-like protein